MPVSVMSRNNFPPLLAPGLRHIFLQFADLEIQKAKYPLIFHEANSEDAYEIDYEIGGTGPMPEMNEGERPASDGLLQGNTKKYLHLTYGLLSEATWQLVSDDKYGVIKQIPRSHLRSGVYSRESVASSVFNLGGSTYVTNDGVSLFNTAHPLLGGPEATNVAPGVSNIINSAGTYPNRPNPDTDLSFTAIQQAVNMFNRIPDGRGIPAMVRPKWLLIPPELIFIAREILGSPGKPYTTDNEVNSLQGEDLKFVWWDYLTSPSAWFLLAEKEGHLLKFYEREALTGQTDDDFKTKVLMFLSTQRFSAGATTWYGTWGTFGP